METMGAIAGIATLSASRAHAVSTGSTSGSTSGTLQHAVRIFKNKQNSENKKTFPEGI
jgi:hypothetical protein